MAARGGALPFIDSASSGTRQIITNCSVVKHCRMEFTSPLVDSWHYLAVSNQQNKTIVVNLQVSTSGK